MAGDELGGKSELRQGVKNLSMELEYLTKPEGPLYKLVDEVKKSNKLSRSNQRNLRLTLLGLVLCMAGVAFTLHLANISLKHMSSLEQSQADAVEQAHDLSDQLEQAQDAIEDAPKIVANDQGGLSVVATVQIEGSDASVTPAEKKAKRKKKRAKKKVDDALSDLELPQVKDVKPDPDEAKPEEVEHPRQVIEIPIQMERIELKEVK